MGLHQGALRFAAATVLTAVAACGNDAPSRPEWTGDRALSTERKTANEYAVRFVGVDDPETVAAQLLGVPRDQATVHVSPVSLDAERPASPGDVPDFGTARAAAERVMKALRMVPAEWTLRDGTVVGGARVVLALVSGETATFAYAGSREPAGSFHVDAKGVRKFNVTPARLSHTEVPVISEREAFDRLTRPNRYVQASLVYLFDGKDRIRPAYDFLAEDRSHEPVVAVLTP